MGRAGAQVATFASAFVSSKLRTNSPPMCFWIDALEDQEVGRQVWAPGRLPQPLPVPAEGTREPGRGGEAPVEPARSPRRRPSFPQACVLSTGGRRRDSGVTARDGGPRFSSNRPINWREGFAAEGSLASCHCLSMSDDASGFS